MKQFELLLQHLKYDWGEQILKPAYLSRNGVEVCQNEHRFNSIH